MSETTPIRLGTARVLIRGEPGYDEARCAGWNAKKPTRFPDVIAIVTSEQDIIEAISFARLRGMKVAVRGGGHNMYGSSVRDGGVLIDVSQLREVSIDPASPTASVQPGIRNGEFATALAEHGLSFPVGHDPTLPLSGYLLSGGLGWNSGAWGPACFSVRSVDVVTSDGVLVTADENKNSDLYWAARGAGAGFFGVATRFQLSLYPLPAFIRMSSQQYPLAEADEIGRWISAIAPQLPPTVEMQVRLETAAPAAAAGQEGKVVTVRAVAFADGEEEATQSLSMMETSPILERAVARVAEVPVTFELLQRAVALTMPEAHRYSEDTLWSNESPALLIPRLAEHMANVPSKNSFVMASMKAAPWTLPDAAFSMVGKTFVWCCSIWENDTDDKRNEGWLRDMMRSVQPLGIGHYIAGANALADPSRIAKSFAADNWEKLQTLRKRNDPDMLFHSFLKSE